MSIKERNVERGRKKYKERERDFSDFYKLY